MADDAEGWLARADVNEPTRKTLLAIFEGCRQVSRKLETASCDSMACFNELGGSDAADEEQLAIDVLAEEILFKQLSATGVVAHASSESDKLVRSLRQGLAEEECVSVAMSPLGTASVMDCNFAVGSIFGVWGGDSLHNVTGSQLAAACACTYGPRTVLMFALSQHGATHEFVLVGGKWSLSNTYEGMASAGKLCAPGNARAAADNAGYAKLLQHWLANRYQLRCTGVAAPDVLQLVVKGRGVYASVASAGCAPPLRLLYEAVPLAFLVERAGGTTSDGSGASLLTLPIVDVDDRTQLALGSAEEVARFDEMVGRPVPSSEEPLAPCEPWV